MVRVKTKEGEFSGMLMPGGGKRTVVLKLDSGYNVGIDRKRIAKISVVKKAIHAATKADKVVPKKGLPNVAILATGGTISSKVDYKSGAVTPSISAGQLVKDIPQLKDIANIKCLSVMNKLSEDINLQDWKRIAKAVYNELVDDSVAGVIVMHGTDTMHYTSAALSFMLRDLNKPVVLTGAQRSSDRGSSDARMNLLCAAHLAMSNLAEVMICMHGSMDDNFCLAHMGTRVRKMHTSRRDAFRSINAEPVARVFPDGRIELISGGKRKSSKNPTRKDSGSPRLDTRLSPDAAMIYVHSNVNPKLVDWYAKQGCRGIVLMGTGLGHVPSKGFLSSMKRAIKKNVSIFMTSQCLYGRVNPHVYSTAREIEKAGVTYLEDMLPETALVKLMWSLGHAENQSKVRGFQSEVRALMLENMAGEISMRSSITANDAMGNDIVD